MTQTACGVCGELRFTWELKYVPFHDVWVCKKHPKKQIEKKLGKEEEEDRIHALKT